MAERGTAQGIFFAGAHLGGGLTPLLVAALLQVMPWRMVFLLFGTVGIILGAGLVSLVSRRPGRPPPGQRRRAEPDPQRAKGGESPAARRAGAWRIVTNPNMILLCLMYFTQAYGFLLQFDLAADVSQGSPGVLAGVWRFAGGFAADLELCGADLVGGFATDRAARFFGLRLGRCGWVSCRWLLAGATLIAGRWRRSHGLGALDRRVGRSRQLPAGSGLGACLDIAGPHAGLVTGTMNTAGQLGAFLSPILLPYMIGSGSGLRDSGAAAAGGGRALLAGACCWLFVDPETPCSSATTNSGTTGACRARMGRARGFVKLHLLKTGPGRRSAAHGLEAEMGLVLHRQPCPPGHCSRFAQGQNAVLVGVLSLDWPALAVLVDIPFEFAVRAERRARWSCRRRDRLSRSRRDCLPRPAGASLGRRTGPGVSAGGRGDVAAVPRIWRFTGKLGHKLG